jgi:hypothetical protein
MADFAAYSLERTLTEQAVLARNQTTPDQWQAVTKDNFQPYLTVPCRLYWAKSTGARSANRTYTDASRDVPVTAGGMLLPSDTDVTEQDEIMQVNRWDPPTQAWVVEVLGPMKITSVINQHTHVELSIERTQLGA